MRRRSWGIAAQPGSGLVEVLGVDLAIAKRCFNHSMGKVTATYDTGRYVAQRREAMDKLGKLVAAGRAPVA